MLIVDLMIKLLIEEIKSIEEEFYHLCGALGSDDRDGCHGACLLGVVNMIVIILTKFLEAGVKLDNMF